MKQLTQAHKINFLVSFWVFHTPKVREAAALFAAHGKGVLKLAAIYSSTGGCTSLIEITVWAGGSTLLVAQLSWISPTHNQ